MKRARKVFLVTGILAIAAMSAAFTVALARPEGLRMANPAPGQAVGARVDVAGDAWFPPDSTALAAVSVAARGPAGETLLFPVERLVVKDRGRPLFSLSRYRGTIELPSEGRWELRAIARSTVGREISSEPRTVAVSKAGGVAAFRSFGLDHAIPVLLIATAAIVAAFITRRRGAAPRSLAWAVSVLIWADEIFYQCWWFAQGGWSAPGSLMFQMCGIAIVILPIALLMDEGAAKRRLVELLWFWGLGGATQALLSPDIGASGFPNVRYFCFFVSHGLIIVGASVLVAGSPRAIDFKAYLRVMLVSNLILLPMAAVNSLIALIPPHDPGNYFILGYPPPEGSPVDFLASVFGPSPRYFIGLEIMALVIFALLWLPFALARRGARAAR